jgi:flagellar hook-length control protein FliK
VDVPLPGGAALDEQNEQLNQLNTARAARGLRAAVAQQGGSVTLRLTPPEMGTVRIQMQMDDGVVRAQLVTQSAAARDLLSQQLAELRQALQSQGLVVERLSVHTMTSGQTSLSQQHAGDGADEHGQTPSDGRSRGQYAGDGGSQPDDRDEPGGRPRTARFEQALVDAVA